MTDADTARLAHLIDQSTPGPWTVQENERDEIIIANRAGHARALGDQVRFSFEAGNPEADPKLVALAPKHAWEILRMRRELGAVREAWLLMISDPERTPVEQNFAMHVVNQIDSVLKAYDEE